MATGENCFLSGWQEGEITLLRHQQGRFGFRIPKVTPGFTAFAHARAAGKLLLAHLPRPEVRQYLDLHPLRPLTPRTIVGRRAFDRELASIRANGFAVDDEEFMDGVAGVAAPVRRRVSVVRLRRRRPRRALPCQPRALRPRRPVGRRRLAEDALAAGAEGEDDSAS